MSSEVAAALPRYVEIRRDLEGKIMSGAWRPGHRVPSEHDLMEQYDCSRMTVNKAVSALAEAGLIVRRRRSGSFVAAPQSQTTVLQISDIKTEVTASSRPYRHDILARKVRAATADDLERLGLDAPARVMALRVTHYAADIPFVLEDRLINLSHVPEAEAEDFRAKPPGTWLLAHIPWTSGQHVIRAVAAAPKVAHALGIAEGAPCLMIGRRTWQVGTPITHVRLYYPGDGHEIVAGFTS